MKTTLKHPTGLIVQQEGLDRITNPGKLNFSGFSQITEQRDRILPITPQGGGAVYPYFGDGSDGSLAIPFGVNTSVAGLMLNNLLLRDAFFENLTIEQGAVLWTNNFRLFVRDTLINNGFIQVPGEGGDAGAVGATGSDAVGGPGGIANSANYFPAMGNGGVGGNGKGATIAAGLPGGVGETVTLGVYPQDHVTVVGGQGGGGGANSGGSFGPAGGVGGQPGSYTALASTFGPYQHLINIQLGRVFSSNGLSWFRGMKANGGGGGGGAGQAGGGISGTQGGGGGGGGGGGNAGTILVCARRLAGTGTIRANGGPGGGGGTGGPGGTPGGDFYGGGGGGGGGGAGGNGGLVFVVYQTISRFSGVVEAKGGLGGPGGAGGLKGGGTATDGGNGTNGMTGVDGIVRLIKA